MGKTSRTSKIIFKPPLSGGIFPPPSLSGGWGGGVVSTTPLLNFAN